eukprot:12064451-Ditylum_brightwellii.AAC.1
MVTKIGHITKINPMHIYCVVCQEQLNEALAVVTSELDKEDKAYFQNYGTTWELANFEVHLKPAKPNITVGQNHVKTSALAVYALRSHVHSFLFEASTIEYKLHTYCVLCTKSTQHNQ